MGPGFNHGMEEMACLCSIMFWPWMEDWRLLTHKCGTWIQLCTQQGTPWCFCLTDHSSMASSFRRLGVLKMQVPRESARSNQSLFMTLLQKPLHHSRYILLSGMLHRWTWFRFTYLSQRIAWEGQHGGWKMHYLRNVQTTMPSRHHSSWWDVALWQVGNLLPLCPMPHGILYSTKGRDSSSLLLET